MVIGVTAVVVVISLINGFNVYIDEDCRASDRQPTASDDSALKISRTPTRLRSLSGNKDLTLTIDYLRSRVADGSTAAPACHLSNHKEGR
jgi:hypothetical protein